MSQMKADIFKIKTQHIVAIALIGFWIALAIVLIIIPIPQQNAQLFNRVIDTLVTITGVMSAYLFGVQKVDNQSKAKTE